MLKKEIFKHKSKILAQKWQIVIITLMSNTESFNLYEIFMMKICKEVLRINNHQWKLTRKSLFWATVKLVSIAAKKQKLKQKNNKMNEVNLFTSVLIAIRFIYQSLKLEAYFGSYDTASNIYDKDLLQKWLFFRSSHRRCSVRKGVLRNFAKFTWKHLCQSLFLNKVTGWGQKTLRAKKLRANLKNPQKRP